MFRRFKRISLFPAGVSLVIALLLSACASYDGRGLKPGITTLPEVIALMGEPAMRWNEPDGRVQLAYPRGPAGTQTYMAYVAADGRLERIEGVLETPHFARIRPGVSDENDVLKLIGPPQPQWTVYFKARDELAWEWNICDDWHQVARFHVLFDATTGIVRSAFQLPPPGDINLFGERSGNPPSCAH
jgi:hypothetical protein